MNRWLALIGFIALCLAVGGFAGFVTRQSVSDWYPTLVKPDWTPPPWLFAPVWTLLYLMMAVAAWIVWQKAHARPALWLFSLQLALNFLWSFLFFGLRSPVLGLIDVVLLWLAIVATIFLFQRSSTLAAVLLLPYLAWVSFATALNTAIVVLN